MSVDSTGSVPARLELRSTRLDHFKSFTNNSFFFAAKRARRPPTPVSTVRSAAVRSAIRDPVRGGRAARARLALVRVCGKGKEL